MISKYATKVSVEDFSSLRSLGRHTVNLINYKSGDCFWRAREEEGKSAIQFMKGLGINKKYVLMGDGKYGKSQVWSYYLVAVRRRRGMSCCSALGGVRVWRLPSPTCLLSRGVWPCLWRAGDRYHARRRVTFTSLKKKYEEGKIKWTPTNQTFCPVNA